MASHLRSRLILGGNAMISASPRRITQASWSWRSLPSRRTFSASTSRCNDQAGSKRPPWWIAWIGYRRDGTPRAPYTKHVVGLVSGLVYFIVYIYVKRYIKKAREARALPAATVALVTLLEDAQTIDREHYAHTDFSDFESSSQYLGKLVTALHQGQKPIAALGGGYELFGYQDDWLDVIRALARKKDPEELEKARRVIADTCEKIREQLCVEQVEKDGPDVAGVEIMTLITQALGVLGKLHLPENGKIPG